MTGREVGADPSAEAASDPLRQKRRIGLTLDVRALRVHSVLRRDEVEREMIPCTVSGRRDGRYLAFDIGSGDTGPSLGVGDRKPDVENPDGQRRQDIEGANEKEVRCNAMCRETRAPTDSRNGSLR